MLSFNDLLLPVFVIGAILAFGLAAGLAATVGLLKGSPSRVRGVFAILAALPTAWLVVKGIRGSDLNHPPVVATLIALTVWGLVLVALGLAHLARSSSGAT